MPAARNVTPSPSSPFLWEEATRASGGGIPPSNDRPSRQAGFREAQWDAFDQWAALLRREARGAYAARAPFGTPEEAESRERLCLWCYGVVDHCHLDRSSVAMAFSYFDRLVSLGLVEICEWSLALMTCLYIAFKICSNARCGIASPDQMALLSSGRFAGKDVLAMELRICEGFGWFLNPPLANDFIDVVTNLLGLGRMTEGGLNKGSGHQLVQRARHLCEQSVLDAFFSDKRPSSVAYAAILVSLDPVYFPARFIELLLSLPLACDVEEMHLCAARLHNEGNRTQIVTLTKGDVRPTVKRVRQEEAAELRYEDVNAEEGVEARLSKKRRMH